MLARCTSAPRGQGECCRRDFYTSTAGSPKDDPGLLDEWMAQWSDLVIFEEVVQVIVSDDAESRARANP